MSLKGIFKGIGKGVEVTVKATAPLVLTAVQPEAIVNVIAGGVLKHKIPGFNNQNIPVANILGSVGYAYIKGVATTGDVVGAIVPAVKSGAILAGSAWAIHQSAKVPAAQWIKDPVLANKVGPGEKFSL